jgi:hypothetical protein
VESYKNYVHAKMLDLDINSMRMSCERMRALIQFKFMDSPQHYSGQATMTTKLYGAYNLLMYSYPQFHELFQEIVTMFRDLYGDDGKKYYIQCWLNVYEKGEFIDWHDHWLPQQKAYHGFYCVDVEPDSKTSYALCDDDEIIDVPSRDNLLVISKSDGDLHRSSEWHDETRPRITIAFDIVPRESINPEGWLNHWIPI